MLFYHHARDLWHCMLRQSVILTIAEESLFIEQIKIADFVCLFPQYISQIRLPRAGMYLRRLAEGEPKSYELVPNPRRLMFELGRVHDLGFLALISKRLVFRNDADGSISLSGSSPSKHVIKSVKVTEFAESSWVNEVVKVISKIPVDGKDGLKARTGLMEYRYDGK